LRFEGCREIARRGIAEHQTIKNDVRIQHETRSRAHRVAS
jgi:hypothetical protein